MKITTKKIIGFGIAALAAMLVVFGWQPISAATSRIVAGYYNIKINDGLVGYWPFELGSTTQNIAKDFSLGGNDGAISGAATSTFQATGVNGQGLRFDGVDDTVTVADSSNLSFSGDFSVSVWAKFTTSFSPNWGTIVSKRLGTNPFDQWNIVVSDACDSAGTGGTSFCFLTCNSNTCTGAAGSAGMNDNRWHFVTAVRSGSNIILYVDGAQANSASRAGTFNSSKPLSIGVLGDSGGLYQFAGSLDDIRVYNRALSPAEVSYMNSHTGPGSSGAVKQPTKSGLVGFWNFDDCDSCSTAKDYSVNSNNGTMYSAAGPTAGNLHIANGKVRNAAIFDGADDYIDMGSSAALDPTVFTASAWFTTSDISGQLHPPIINNSDASAGYTLEIDNTNTQLNIWAYIGGSFRSAGAYPIALNKWYHAVGTYDGSTLKLYINGELVASTSISGTVTASASPLWIGHNYAIQTRYFEGTIDEVRIYSRALTADEIKDLYHDTSKRIINASASRQTSNDALIELSFDGTNVDWSSSSAEIKDTSGSGKDGDAGGMSKTSSIRIGPNGQALYFDGVDDYVVTTYNGPTVAPISFVFWAKPDTATPVGMFDSAPGVGNVLRNYSNGQIEWWGGDPTISFTLNPGVWQHIIVTYWFDTNRHVDMYVDGVLKSSGTGGTGNTIAWNGLRLGDINNGGNGRYAGALDSFRVYAKKITAGEAAAIYYQDKHGGR